MSTAFAIMLSFFSLSQIQEIKIADKGVETALNAFIDSINSKNEKPIVNYDLNARIENLGFSKIIYVSTAISIGSYKLLGTPDKYSRLGNRIVFWYESKNRTESLKQFEEFQKQFGEYLVNDLSSDGSINTNFNPDQLSYFDFVGADYRFVIKGNSIISSKEICQFPGLSFYQKGLTYDKNGYLMYRDGVYDICSLDRPYKFEREGFEPMVYIRINSGISNEITKKNKIIATITINKKGKPIKADIDDADKVLNDQQIRKLKEVILGMPHWNAQTVKGKRVCYRITTKL
jgi:hypothetical protein